MPPTPRARLASRLPWARTTNQNQPRQKYPAPQVPTDPRLGANECLVAACFNGSECVFGLYELLPLARHKSCAIANAFIIRNNRARTRMQVCKCTMDKKPPRLCKVGAGCKLLKANFTCRGNPASQTYSLLASVFAAFLPSAISLRFFAANAERRLETFRR